MTLTIYQPQYSIIKFCKGSKFMVMVIFILTNADHVLANGIEVIDLFLLRSVNDNDGGTKNAEETADLTMEVELLIKQGGRQNSTVCVCVCVCVCACNIRMTLYDSEICK